MPASKVSTCALDCPDACSLLVRIGDDGRAVALKGNPAHPVTQGFLCAKVTRYLDRVYHPGRLMYPLRRTGPKGEGRFERISWDQALDTIAARLMETAAAHGSESILPYSYAGTMGYLNGSGMDRRFFHRLGASRLNRTICSSAGGAALAEVLGARLGTGPGQFADSKLIIVWGANVHATNVHLWPFIEKARRKGAKLVVIDPVRTRIASLADQWITPYPGSDLALALGLIHVILGEGLYDRDFVERHTKNLDSLLEHVSAFSPKRVEELTGVPSADIETLAREYASTRPAAIRLGYGIQRSERGGRAIHAAALLPALTGSWKDYGGGLQLTTSGAFDINRNALERPDLQRKSLGREARVVNMALLGQALTALDNPRVHALVVYNSNPAAIAPNQALVREGLRREDLFTVVLEQFLTDTAHFADIVLPSTTFLEHTDAYFAYGHYHMQMAEPVLGAPGETRSNVDVFRDLAHRCGFDDPCFNDTGHDMIRALLDTPSPYLAGVTFERLQAERSVPLNVDPLPFANGFRTADGKCDLDAAPLAYEPPVESRLGDLSTRARFPLELVSSKNHDSMNSTFGNRPDTDAQTAILEIHPDDARPRDIRDGDAVRVFNSRGAVELTARVGPTVRPGVVRAPSVRRGVNVNTLISDRLTDIGGGPTFYSCLVEIAPCAPSRS